MLLQETRDGERDEHGARAKKSNDNDRPGQEMLRRPGRRPGTAPQQFSRSGLVDRGISAGLTLAMLVHAGGGWAAEATGIAGGGGAGMTQSRAGSSLVPDGEGQPSRQSLYRQRHLAHGHAGGTATSSGNAGADLDPGTDRVRTHEKQARQV